MGDETMVTCPRCDGDGSVQVAILYPNPPSRVLTMLCPGCGGNRTVADAATAEQLITERNRILDEAKADVPWLKKRRILADFRQDGIQEFIVMRAKM